MWLLITAVSLMLSTLAYAQQESDALQRRLRAFDMVTAQRNQAMDAVAVCIGESTAQLEALRKELEQAKKQCSPPEKP